MAGSAKDRVVYPLQKRVVRDICPGPAGAKDWNPSAFSKATGLIYVPHNNLCMDWEIKPVSYLKGTPYIGVNPRFYPGQGGNAGEFMAWDPIARRKAWTIPERWPVWSGWPWPWTVAGTATGPAASAAIRCGPAGAPR